MHVELDNLYWLPNWTPRPTDEFRELVTRAVEGDRWVLDGNYAGVRDLVWRRATAVIYLDVPLPVLWGRLAKRTLTRIISRQEICGGNRESLRTWVAFDGLPLWILRTYRKYRRIYPEIIRQHALPSITLRSRQQVRAFVAGLTRTH